MGTLTIGNIGGNLSGNVAGGDITQTSILTPQQQQDVKTHKAAAAQELAKGDKADAVLILEHLTAAAKISAKAVAPAILGAAGKLLAGLLD